MSALDSQSSIERLPTELLERIFLFNSARDTLRLSLVNHAFYSLIRASPSIQYKIDLFGAGLQPNSRTEISLADCRAALEAYCRRWKSLDPAEKWDRVFHVSGIQDALAVSGTCGILWRDSIRFFNLGSGSRGIPRREWDILLKHVEASTFTFYPQANIMAIVEEVVSTWIIYLNTLSDGEPHPKARIKTLSYNFAPGNPGPVDIVEMSITSSRLAVLRGDSDIQITQIVVWDWTTGEILLQLENRFCRSIKFVDDYWLALIIASSELDCPPRLVLFNTEQTPIDHPTLVQTTFHFDPREHFDVDGIRLQLDQGGYEPSPEEASLAPFYQDASQRVLVVEFYSYESAFVMKVEALLELAREQGGADLEWEQWNAHVVEIQTRGGIVLWVSGPRVFCICRTEQANEETWMNVHDFSPREFARCVETVTNSRDGMFLRRVGWPPSVEKHHLPWHAPTIQFSDGGHDSIVLLLEPQDGENLSVGIMHVWNF